MAKKNPRDDKNLSHPKSNDRSKNAISEGQSGRFVQHEKYISKPKITMVVSKPPKEKKD